MAKQGNPVEISVLNLVIDETVNCRKETYDLPSMEDSILQEGRIIDPIFFREEDKVVLRGNRRTGGGQNVLRRLLQKTTLTPKEEQLKWNLEHVVAIPVSGLTDDETFSFVLDHGTQNPLNREEIVENVWKMQRKMYSFGDIAVKMYKLLARFVGNERKALEIQTMPVGPARAEALRKWLKGTLDDYLLKSGKMGDFVRQQVRLTERERDGTITEVEKTLMKFRTSRDRINKLYTAMLADEKVGLWTNEHGPEFDKVVEQFASQDAGTAPPEPKGYSQKEVKDASGTMKSSTVKAVLQKIAGTLPVGAADIDHWDTESFRLERVLAVLQSQYQLIPTGGTFSGAELKELVELVLKGTEVQVQTFLKKVTTPPTPSEKPEPAADPAPAPAAAKPAPEKNAHKKGR